RDGAHRLRGRRSHRARRDGALHGTVPRTPLEARPLTFHSIDFVVFFIVVVVLYWRLSHRRQNLLLLIASYFFYGYVHPWFLSLIFATTVIDYWAARGMAAMPARRRLFMGWSLAGNLGMLGFFKYFNFFAENVHALLALIG